MITDPNCIFCKIAHNEAPADKVYEDEQIVAFLDLRPSNRGHTLVVHKEHSPDFLTSTDETIMELMSKVKRVAEGVVKTVHAPGVNITINNGTAAGQVVFHLHVHIIPRYSNDGLQLFPQKDSEFASRKALAEEIRKNIL